MPFVEPPVATTAAAAFSSDSRVITCDGRTSSRTSSITSLPAARALSSFARVERRDAVQAGRRDAEELERSRHRVRRELAAARACARARDRLELVQVLVAQVPGGMGADPLVDLLDRHLSPAEDARRDRPGVEHQARQVEPAQGHCGRRARLVAGDDADQAVEQVAAGDELDRVRDHLAGRERRPHPLGPHRDAVRDSDRVELDGRAASLADCTLDVDGERALVEIARHRLDPRRANADERLREVVVVEAGALEHRPGAGPVRAVGEGAAAPLRGVAGASVGACGRTHDAT